MELDKECGLMRFVDAEQRIAKLEPVLPIEEADIALEAALKAKQRVEGFDPSEFPAGAHKAKLVGQQLYERRIIETLIDDLCEVLPPKVASGAEDFLRDQS